MSIRPFEDKRPFITKSAFIDSAAVVIGDVVIGEDSSIWPTTVIRGDINHIKIGDRTSIQDGTVIHVNHAGPFNPQGNPTIVGNEVTVGHRVTLHGCTIEDTCLIGIGSIVMDGAIVQSQVVIGAGSLVPPGKIVESGYLWLGSPVKQIRLLTEQELSFLTYTANYYVSLKNRHLAMQASMKNSL